MIYSFFKDLHPNKRRQASLAVESNINQRNIGLMRNCAASRALKVFGHKGDCPEFFVNFCDIKKIQINSPPGMAYPSANLISHKN